MESVRTESQSRRSVYLPERLRPLIAPRSVAVVGVSERSAGFGSRAALNLVDAGWTGTLYAVNPKYDEVHGISCLPRVSDLPAPVDCLVVAVASSEVRAVVTEALEAGRARSVLIFSSGLAETGDDGFHVERALGHLAHDYGVPISGPNTAGVFNFVDGTILSFVQHMDAGRAGGGPVAVVSQSTGIGVGLAHARERGVPISYSLNAGNSCDVDVVDYAAFCVADEAVRAVALSFEGLRDPRRLFELGESARARGKRVVVLKTGRSNAASAAVQSHTGSVSGDYATFRSLFEQAGLVEVDSMEELIETARLAANWPADDVGGVGVLTNSGGTAIMAADYADEFDLPLPSLSEATTTALAAHAPGFASLANPADLTANADDWASLTESIVSFSEDPRIDLVVLPMPAPDLGERALQRPRAILEAVDRAPVSLCVVWMSEMLRAPASDLLDADPQLVTFRSLRRCMQAIGRLRYRPPVFVDGATAPGKSIVSTVAAAVDEALVKAGLVESGCITLDEAASRAILAAAGIEQVRAQEVSTAEEAVAAASTIGYPVVVKGVLRGVAHKSDLGAVRLGLADAAGVDSACREIRASVATEAPDAEVSGFLVAAMETGGFEAFVGARRDALFGAVVVGGAGGTAMESLDDVQVGIAPLPHGRATELIDRLRCAPQLRSGRGASGFDLGAFGSALDAVGQLILADERITDIDVNPLLLRPADGGAVALDASVTLRLVGPESKYDPSGGWDE